MKIKMRTSAAGPDGNFADGAIYEVPSQISAKQAQDFLAGGYAVSISKPVTVAPVLPVPAETAEVETIAPAETAVAIPQRGRPRLPKK